MYYIVICKTDSDGRCNDLCWMKAIINSSNALHQLPLSSGPRFSCPVKITKGFTSTIRGPGGQWDNPFPSWDLQRVEPGMPSKRNCQMGKISAAILVVFPGFVSLFLLKLYIYIYYVYLLELEIFKSFRLRKGSSDKNSGMALANPAKPRRASLLGEAFGRRCRCLCHRWCSLNTWRLML